MGQGWRGLSEHWGVALGFSLLFILIVAAAGSLGVVALVLVGPLLLGQAIFFLTLSRGGKPTINMMFDGMQNFGESLIAYLLLTVFLYAGMLLGALPGVILGLAFGFGIGLEEGLVVGFVLGYLGMLIGAIYVQLRYDLAFCLMADDRDLRGTQALRSCRMMMEGHKWRLFRMQLLLGLIALAATLLTCGIGAVLLTPWFMSCRTKFYEDLLPPADAAAPDAANAPPVPRLG